ncbi:MAG: 1,4-alpha-glucan branching protein GlgB [Fusicatenibacter sp.]|nr:1,4-alpha-glucan branching protein GlgB [Fusicatenibacter sp.]
MEERLYEYMDWAEIEAVVYSEENHPRTLLGPHITPDGVLIQGFFPDAKKAAVRTIKDGETYEMVMEDEAGYFAVLVPGNEIPEYTLVYTDAEGHQVEHYDPYAFPSQFTEKEQKQFEAGIYYNSYEKLGAHPMIIDEVSGVYFAVWAPNAIRVSVVGNFNNWDGRAYQMNLLDSGIYELFIPGVRVGDLYKYEIKAKGGLTYLKSDPYASAAQLRPNNASVVADLGNYVWQDEAWMKQRRNTQGEKAPISIYEMHLGSWRKPDDGREFYNCREIAPMLAEYVKEMGFTHVELMPVMEHPLDESWGYQVTGYYAPTARYGTPDDFRYFVDYLHGQGIGVILDWVPAHFPRDTFGLSAFDGTCLYEHFDPRQGAHPHWGTLIYNYGRPQVSNFLISNALFWAKEYHADGIRMDAVASMLYLDYGKNDGEWVANIYGGNENLQAIEFLKHLNSVFKKEFPDALLIAEESTAWPKVTGALDDDGLGFDYKWNMGWMNDFTEYMKNDPVFRGYHHNQLTFSMVYAFSEKFLLSLSHDEVVHMKGSMYTKMPGNPEQKMANLRLAYGYQIAHPGKKLMFMGQEFAQEKEWNEKASLQWDVLDNERNQQFKDYMAALQKVYKEYPALHELDSAPEGFEWINGMEWEKNLLIFLRKTEKKEETLLVVCNFSNMEYDDFRIGVPYPGKYKEIFNSDAKGYGGTGVVNPRVKMSKKMEWDERPDSISVKIPPLGISIFTYAKAETGTATNRTAKKKQAAKSVKESTAEVGEISKEKAVKTAGRKTKKAAAEEKTAAKSESKAVKAVKELISETVGKKAEKEEKKEKKSAKTKKETPVKEKKTAKKASKKDSVSEKEKNAEDSSLKKASLKEELQHKFETEEN